MYAYPGIQGGSLQMPPGMLRSSSQNMPLSARSPRLSHPQPVLRPLQFPQTYGGSVSLSSAPSYTQLPMASVDLPVTPQSASLDPRTPTRSMPASVILPMTPRSHPHRMVSVVMPVQPNPTIAEIRTNPLTKVEFPAESANESRGQKQVPDETEILASRNESKEVEPEPESPSCESPPQEPAEAPSAPFKLSFGEHSLGKENQEEVAQEDDCCKAGLDEIVAQEDFCKAVLDDMTSQYAAPSASPRNTQKKSSAKHVVAGAAGGAVALGTGGGAVGAAAGLPLALFTFGLSVPIGAAIGSVVGGAAGAVGGGAIGHAVSSRTA